MSIQELSRDFKGFLKKPDHLLALLIVVVSGLSFGLGRLSVTPSSNFQGQEEASVQAPRVEAMSTKENTETVLPNVTPVEGGYVASKSGTKYHLPWCGSAKQIKEENKIWFASKAEAEAAGYTPASNCKGI